jgi:hypothetical protein
VQKGTLSLGWTNEQVVGDSFRLTELVSYVSRCVVVLIYISFVFTCSLSAQSTSWKKFYSSLLDIV